MKKPMKISMITASITATVASVIVIVKKVIAARKTK